ncbi:MAG: hypothetical protein KAY82_00965 [Hylemonella sp.]|nr:hypothetical protein [Hylemonella sp.]
MVAGADAAGAGAGELGVGAGVDGEGAGVVAAGAGVVAAGAGVVAAGAGVELVPESPPPQAARLHAATAANKWVSVCVFMEIPRCETYRESIERAYDTPPPDQGGLLRLRDQRAV